MPRLDLDEFFAMVDFCNPGVLGTMAEFRKKYEARPLALLMPARSFHFRAHLPLLLSLNPLLFVSSARMSEPHPAWKGARCQRRGVHQGPGAGERAEEGRLVGHCARLQAFHPSLFSH